jgi:phenylacetate-CoA ligase
VPPGGVGELVVTNLWAEAFPYLRYRMGDIVTYENDPCPCGRTSMRMKVLGRLPWSVRVGGVRIFHGEVENVLWNRPEMEGAKYQLVRRRSQPQEALEVRVGPRSPVSSDVAEATRLEMSAAFDVPVVLTVVDPGELGLQNLIKMERLIEID